MRMIWPILALGACAYGAPVDTTPLNSAPRGLTARPPQSVEVYSSSPPSRPHVDVALLRVEEGGFSGTPGHLVQALLEKAAELGCDALYISGASERAGNPKLGILDPGTNTLFGTCLAYLSATPADSTPPRAANAIVLVAHPAARAPEPAVDTGE